MEQLTRIKVWDGWTRLFHWSLVLAVGFLLFSGKTGELFFDWHRYIGEGVFALMLFRLIYGFIGSSNIRFSSLLTNPIEAFKHLGHFFKRSLHPERGHNAAGAYAVLAMILLLSVQATTGLFITDEDNLLEGALYGSISSDTTDLLMTIHYWCADFIMVIIGVHIAMVILYKLWGRQNLITPMITGYMSWPKNLETPALFLQKWWVGLIVALIVFIVTAKLCHWAIFNL